MLCFASGQCKSCCALWRSFGSTCVFFGMSDHSCGVQCLTSFVIHPPLLVTDVGHVAVSGPLAGTVPSPRNADIRRFRHQLGFAVATSSSRQATRRHTIKAQHLRRGGEGHCLDFRERPLSAVVLAGRGVCSCWSKCWRSTLCSATTMARPTRLVKKRMPRDARSLVPNGPREPIDVKAWFVEFHSL